MSIFILNLRSVAKRETSIGHAELGHILDAAADEIERLNEALSDISNPIAKFRRDAEAAGAVVNGGMAIMLADDPHYLRGIAKAALASSGA